MSTRIEATFDDEQQVQRLLFLLHRDLARVVGNQVLAEEQLEAHRNGHRLSGRQRERAERTVATTPDQERVLRGAQAALRDALKQMQRP